MRNFAINGSQTLAAAACDDRKTYVWSLVDGEQVAALAGHDWVSVAGSSNLPAPFFLLLLFKLLLLLFEVVAFRTKGV